MDSWPIAASPKIAIDTKISSSNLTEQGGSSHERYIVDRGQSTQIWLRQPADRSARLQNRQATSE